MSRYTILMAGALLGAAAMAAPAPVGGSALAALKLIPKGAAAKLARIEARGANPAPERWYILVHDPKEENGVHEYVVAAGEVVASRALSQFAETLTADDVIGETIKIDSDRAVKIAQQFAETNARVVADMNVELKKDGAGAAPLWTVTCLDADGNDAGHVVLSATKATIISHEGFDTQPPQISRPEAAITAPERRVQEPKRQEVRRAEPLVVGEQPVEAPPRKGGLFHRMSHLLPWPHGDHSEQPQQPGASPR